MAAVEAAGPLTMVAAVSGPEIERQPKPVPVVDRGYYQRRRSCYPGRHGMGPGRHP
jgi:hypothetical protein